MPRLLVIAALVALLSAQAGADAVQGRVVMPATCSPTVSPAVVTLEPVDGRKVAAPTRGTLSVAVVNQHGLQFEPRVQVMTVGDTLRFTNQDGEPHSVHMITPGFPFMTSMAPNSNVDYTPTKAGIIRLVCDIHSHMRGFVVVSATPWFVKTKADGSFRFKTIPAGVYKLTAWHEMGEPVTREVTIKADEPTDLDSITLEAFPVSAAAAALLPVRPWPDVIDRIGVCLAEATEVVTRPDGFKKARKLAEDAYWGEFEKSEMEIAVRRHLGYDRAGAIESQFLGFRAAIKSVNDGKLDASQLAGKSRRLLIDLARASDDLRRLKIFDRRNVAQQTTNTETVLTPGATEQEGQLKALAASFLVIRKQADSDRASDAASGMTDAYFADFEPLERLLNVRRPQEVTPLESRFNSIRGRIEEGVKGQPLQADLDGLVADVTAALKRAQAEAAGSFGPAFAASLITILREGVEVILLLAMLIALVAKAGNPQAMSAIRWGIAGAVVASLLTAVALNLVVASAQGRTREIIEGAVMMAAAGVLFYVSYWLISQTQAKRWTDFIKGQVARGAKAGGLGTLALTAFLAVYREGAETALMYQALISGQGGSREGLLGLAVGLGLGLIVLAVVAYAIRTSSVKLPLRSFFKVSGVVLFAMAVVFAGNAVFELQNAGIIKVSPVSWLGLGLPVLGLHPNTQALSVQGVLILGALLALVLPALETRPASAPQPPKVTPPAAGVGV